MNGKFAEAQRRCEEAQRLADEIGDGVEKTDRDDLIFTQQNLAHALFFQGHYDEALAIYRQNWNKPQMGKTFGEITLVSCERSKFKKGSLRSFLKIRICGGGASERFGVFVVLGEVGINGGMKLSH